MDGEGEGELTREVEQSEKEVEENGWRRRLRWKLTSDGGIGEEVE